ncbi:MAG: AAC(3) family N-acetyltransferase [Putridiphycobacter sp.]
MSLKDLARKLTPQPILNWNRKRKKNNINKALSQQKEKGEILTKSDLLTDLIRIGIKPGDTVLVHSALSRIGFLKDGPKTFVEALLEAVGPEGNILMPTSPNSAFQLNYIQNTPYFDVLNSPSRTGAITEYFRTLPEAKRSLHPTEPVSAVGPRANYFIQDHFNQLTPYNQNSPFYKVADQKGKILYVGVTLDNAGTSLHTLEDAISDFKFPVYHQQIFDFEVIDGFGKRHKVKTKVHNPVFSKKRKCDELIPMFKEKGGAKSVKIGQAETLLFDAKKMFDIMLEQYHENGITMYTPKGS